LTFLRFKLRTAPMGSDMFDGFLPRVEFSGGRDRPRGGVLLWAAVINRTSSTDDKSADIQ
jgi:hypothetical protein